MSDLSNPPAVTPPRIPWLKTPKGIKTLISSVAGVVVVVVAIVLVVTLVVQPNQRAAQAAASASAQAAQDYQDAVTAFNSASDACTSANQQLSAAITSAQSTAKTDPSTMQDPTLIDKLNQAITTAQAVKTCAAPTMASDTATIQQQTTQLGTDAQAVTTAASTLTAAGQAVPASVQAKQQAAAQAQASASAAAQAQATQLVNSVTGTATDMNGYKAIVSVKCTNWIEGSDQAALHAAWQNVGGTGEIPIQTGYNAGAPNSNGFDVADLSTGAYFFCTLTVANGSPGYHLSQFRGGSGSLPVPNTMVGFIVDGHSQWGIENSYDGGACVAYSGGPQCSGPLSDGFDLYVSMNVTSDQWGPVPLVWFAGNVFGPKTPAGDPELATTQIAVGDDSVKTSIGISWA